MLPLKVIADKHVEHTKVIPTGRGNGCLWWKKCCWVWGFVYIVVQMPRSCPGLSPSPMKAADKCITVFVCHIVVASLCLPDAVDEQRFLIHHIYVHSSVRPHVMPINYIVPFVWSPNIHLKHYIFKLVKIYQGHLYLFIREKNNKPVFVDHSFSF